MFRFPSHTSRMFFRPVHLRVGRSCGKRYKSINTVPIAPAEEVAAERSGFCMSAQFHQSTEFGIVRPHSPRCHSPPPGNRLNVFIPLWLTARVYSVYSMYTRVFMCVNYALLLFSCVPTDVRREVHRRVYFVCTVYTYYTSWVFQYIYKS